ncbi:hypothetical protein ACVWXO_006809 [Bradyrhizobium sp. LM2.7]
MPSSVIRFFRYAPDTRELKVSFVSRMFRRRLPTPSGLRARRGRSRDHYTYREITRAYSD